MGSISLTFSTPHSIIFLVPPRSWMVMVWKVSPYQLCGLLHLLSHFLLGLPQWLVGCLESTGNTSMILARTTKKWTSGVERIWSSHFV